MGHSHSFATALFACAFLSRVILSEAYRLPLEKRQGGYADVDGTYFGPLVTPPPTPAVTTSTPLVYALFTPSSSATPVAITRMSQVVTSFVPQLTVCSLPPLAFYSGNFTNPVFTAGAPFYRNYSISIPTGSGDCSTAFGPSPTTICATILTGLAMHVTVTDCYQAVTFSSRYDYGLESLTTTTNQSATTVISTIRPVITYYIAPWQSLGGSRPPQDVTQKVCTTLSDGSTQCWVMEQTWVVEPYTITTTTTSHVDLTTRITGPARVAIETIHVDITKTVTYLTMSTQLELKYELETVRTRKIRKRPTTSSTTSSAAWLPSPTMSVTRTLALAQTV